MSKKHNININSKKQVVLTNIKTFLKINSKKLGKTSEINKH